MLIVLIVVALIFAVAGNLLWKKANKLDPASKKNKFKFWVQNQLGAIISAIAFLPLVFLILTDKNIDGKQKGILGAIAGAALLLELEQELILIHHQLSNTQRKLKEWMT